LSTAVLLYIVYAVVLIAGGVMGYSKAKSTPSLVAGVISGVLAVIAAVLLHLHHPRSGLGLGALLGVALTVVFARRYASTRKAPPAIPIIVLSLIVLVFSLARLLMPPAYHA
jgi:uncharacterized membrane protein (UPF0136 family)